jgi:two-component system cell cycle sensor histidine kinase/response regulator CckA
VINARDAMPGGGKLTVETANVRLGATCNADRPGVPAGEYVLLRIGDTGMGMSEEVKAHLFEPFFTTKPMGKGTGLGLATVQRIVEGSGGYVAVDSAEGAGATFRIYLPRHTAASPQAAPVAREVEALPAGAETILLVEDDERLRDLVRHILQKQGYTVLEACDGRQALAVAADYRDDIHLLLIDVVMPGLGGGEVAERLGHARSGLKVLFMSGYRGDEALLDRYVQADAEILHKPFGAMALGRKVRQVLDG